MAAHRPTYECWVNMKTRCYNQNYARFDRYGGRGIAVCDRWRDGESGLSGYECFVADMGEQPPRLTIERIDNDGPYAPGNCRWATRREQARNRRSSKHGTANGETKCAKEWAATLGVSVNAFATRARKSSVADAVAHYQKHGISNTGRRYGRGA